MAPPTATEQLIRDYLNRLSVAARGLAPDDRRALLERIRGYIERKAEVGRRPSTMDVARVLARLGDPAALVEQERRRLVAQGKSVPLTASAAPGRQRFLSRARGRELGRSRGGGFPWSALRDGGSSAPLPPPNGVSGDIQLAKPGARETRDPAAAGAGEAAAAGGQAAPSPPKSPSAPADGPVPTDGPEPAGPSASAGSGTTHSSPAPTGAVPAKPEAAAAEAQHDGHVSAADDHPAAATPSAGSTERARRTAATSADPVAATGTSKDPAAASGPERAGEQEAAGTATSAADPGRSSARGARWRRVDLAPPRGPIRRQTRRLLGWARKRPLEAAVIVLMGIGGALFPPVFLIGATLALASDLWDGRDKWIGIAVPIVLTVIGLAVGIAAGGRAHWQHESWVYLDFVSRIAPALGAGYLAWRTGRPQRKPTVPPFSRPRRTA